MAEGARLESVYTATYRGFESPPHRHYLKKSSHENAGFFFACISAPGGMRTPDRGSTTGETRWTDHERSEWAARRASKASQSPPVHASATEPVPDGGCALSGLRADLTPRITKHFTMPTSCHVQLPDGGYALSGLHAAPDQPYVVTPSLPHKK